MTNSILRSYQVFGADDEVLKAATESTIQAVKDAKSSGEVQRIVLSRRGYRQDLEVGDIYVVPPAVCNDPADFPAIILHSNLRKHTTGEGMVEFKMGSMVDPEELSRETLQEFKNLVFKNAKGDLAPLIVFAPSWAHPSDFISFVHEEGAELSMLREVAYSAPFDPSLSSSFDQLRACDPDQAPTAKITPGGQHMFRIPASDDQDYPKFARGLDVAAPEGYKKASLGRRTAIRLFKTAAPMPEMEKNVLSDGELDLFASIDKEIAANTGATRPMSALAASLRLADDGGGLGDIGHSDAGTAVDHPAEEPEKQDPAQGGQSQGGGGQSPQMGGEVAGEAAGAGESAAAAGGEAAGALAEVAPLALLASGKNTYKDPEFGKGRELRAQPDYGDQGTKERVGPADVDGTNPMTASKKSADDENTPIVEVGFSEDTPEDTPEKVEDVAGAATGITTAPVRVVDPKKTAGVGSDTVKAVNLFVQDFAGRTVPGNVILERMKLLTDKVKEALVFMRDQGYIQTLGPDSYKILNQDYLAEGRDRANQRRSANFVIKSAKTKSVWAAEDVDGIKLGGYWSKDAAEAATFTTKAAADDEIRRNRLEEDDAQTCEQCSSCKGEGKCGCSKKEKKIAGNWWNPGSVLEQFYPELQHDCVESPFIEQIAGPTINPFGAEGKGAPADPNATGMSQSLENNSEVPLRNEMSFYGPDYARNFYTPHADIDPQCLTFKKQKGAAKKKADSVQGDVRDAVDTAYQWHGGQSSPLYSFASTGGVLHKESGRGSLENEIQEAIHVVTANPESYPDELESLENLLLVAQTIPARVNDEEQDNEAQAQVVPPTHTSSTKPKKADGAMSLFRGLALPEPEPNIQDDEEHPQAHTDETVGDPQVGAYAEPDKNKAIPQDETYKNIDHLLKGVVGAYAAQLISAFQVTSKPIHFDTPFQDKLDLEETITVAGGSNTSQDVADAAVSQFKSALDKMSDDQKKMLLDAATAQAAVWCKNTSGAGGYNYEVFVRAEALDGLMLLVTVVTGRK